MRYGFVQEQRLHFPVTCLCRVIRLSTSGFYVWKAKGAQFIDHQTWLLCSRMKALFAESRQSLGSRRMVQQLRKEGFDVGRYRVRRLMRKLDLGVKKKKRFVITTDSKHLQPVAANLLTREFNPPEANRVSSTDITYIWTVQGWMYLAVVMDLYSRRIVGWHMYQQMTSALVIRALMMAVNLRSPPLGLLHHSDRGSQYASDRYHALLKQHQMVCSMSLKGNCWDNAPTERFFGSEARMGDGSCVSDG